MSISSVLTTGLQGIQAGTAITDRAGARNATFSRDLTTDQVAQSMVDLRVGELQVKLGADVVKVADSLLGTVIDIRA